MNDSSVCCDGLVETFLYWAINQRLIHGITVPRRAVDDAAATIGDPQRMTAIRRILTDGSLALSTARRLGRRRLPRLRSHTNRRHEARHRLTELVPLRVFQTCPMAIARRRTSVSWPLSKPAR
jgi:hypothetical protein